MKIAIGSDHGGYALKEKIKTEVNHELGEGTVYGVYITSFVLQ